MPAKHRVKKISTRSSKGSASGNGRSVAKCFGENLKRLRHDVGLSQQELAQRIGLSKGFLQSIEVGRRWVSPDTVRALAKEFKVSESELFRDCQADTHPDPRTLFAWIGEALGIEAPPSFWAHVRLKKAPAHFS